MRARTIKGRVVLDVSVLEMRRMQEVKEILVMAGRFTNAEIFDQAADGLADAIAAVDKLNEPLPLIEA